MELRQLEYFVTVVEEASFTKAAVRLHVAQPGVSAQIRRLERELGHALLDRSGRTVRPTAVGEAVLTHARAALGAVADVRRAVDELAGLLRGRVAVGMLTACSSVDLADLLADFHRRHPAVEIALSEANSAQLLESLHRGDLDMALVGLATPPPPGIETLVLVDEALVAAVGGEDPLAVHASIALSALEARNLISLPCGTGLRACLDNACAVAGFRPRIAFEASDPTVLAQLAARGLGVAILPESVAALFADELHAIAVTDPPLRGRIELAWKADGPHSPAAAALIGDARRVLGNQPD